METQKHKGLYIALKVGIAFALGMAVAGYGGVPSYFLREQAVVYLLGLF